MSFDLEISKLTVCILTFQATYYGKTDQPYVGEDADNKRGILAIKYPVEFGFISNMDDMELVLSHTFYEHLRLCPAEHPVLMSQPPFSPKGTRETITEVMFERFEVPAFSVQTSAVLALFSSGRTTGVAIDLGGGNFRASVVTDGTFSKDASLTLPISGRFITDYLRQDIQKSPHFTDEQKQDVGRPSYWHFLNQMKQTCCFVSQDFDSDIKNSTQHAKQHELPEGIFVTLDKERFRCTEAIFNPNLYGVEMEGIQHQAYNAALRAPASTTKTLLSNFMLCGGSSLFPGIVSRLENELSKLNKTEYEIKLAAPEGRELAVWNGGAKMAVDKGLGHIWMSKDEYDEYGPTYVHGKTS